MVFLPDDQETQEHASGLAHPFQSGGPYYCPVNRQLSDLQRSHDQPSGFAPV
jgi:hypothetical protein